jgi:peptide/nickel transport system substrate-binding protein
MKQLCVNSWLAGIVMFLAVLSSGPSRLDAQTRVSIGVTETMETWNPYGDSVSLLYGIWCQMYGCLGTYDFEKGDYVGILAERWETTDPNTWLFHLRPDARWHDGSPVTAADVVHSFNRVNNDPHSKQRQNIATIARAEAVNDRTVKFVTKEPTAPLVDYLFDRLIITKKAIFDKYGAEVADREHPIGSGPYKLKELKQSQRLVLEKNPQHPKIKKNPNAPDEVIFQIMREPEQRITALLNDEIQIAQFIPPHLRQRVARDSRNKIVTTDSVEIMFLAMQPKPPFDKKEVRQAVCYAIDRDTIIKTLLEGLATRLDGPVGAGQYGYDPEMVFKYEYNPKKAKELLTTAGYPNGVDVDYNTPMGRYTLDKQISQAIASMLRNAGIRANLKTPEWPTLWANVQKGRVPFYYMGRGGIVDPSRALAQYFETGVSPRIGYSNPKLDKMLAEERKTFDPEKRKRVLAETMRFITEEAPACFLWRHQLLWGMANNIDYKPRPDARIMAADIRVLKQ